jgi:hypothetical protein
VTLSYQKLSHDIPNKNIKNKKYIFARSNIVFERASSTQLRCLTLHFIEMLLLVRLMSRVRHVEAFHFSPLFPTLKRKKFLFTTYFSEIKLNRVQHVGNVAQCVGTLQTNFELCSPKTDLAKPHFQISTNYMQSEL